MGKNLFDIFVKQREVQTNRLIEALFNGDFKVAMSSVERGADGTRNLKEPNKHFYKMPLDLLMANSGHNDETNDLFTFEQRIQIFDALVAKTKNPLDLISDKTLNIALAWGRTEMIPKLASVGVEIKGQHFVKAANPYHRPNKAIETMEAVLPHVRNDVNTVDSSGKNAGHVIASLVDLKAFKWLEKRGLEKNAFAGGVWASTYAHMVITVGSEKRIEFASYLANNGYPIDIPGKDGTTPTECAIDEGQVDVALIYIDAGAEAKPKYLPRIIKATHFNNAMAQDVMVIGEKLAEKGKMDKDTVVLAYKELFRIIGMNDKNLHQGFPIAAYLSSKGVTPREAAKELLQDKNLSEDKSDSIKKVCEQLKQAKKKYKKPKITRVTKPPTP